MPDALLTTNSHRRLNVSSHANSERGDLQQVQSGRRRTDGQPSGLDRCLDELRGRVVQALASLGYPSLVAVDCEVAADRIVLSGALPSYHLKQMAQVAALRVAGPGKVDNRVVVTSL
ncbi:MAG: hypothetical protein C0485_05995 [Pirellula sp.]|nr:hypothetical protein [Pirellula sp.]